MNGWKTMLLWTGAAIAIVMLSQFDHIVARANSNPNLAAWVQAIGSVIAIVAAAAIAGWQSHRSERAENERRRLDQVGKFFALQGILIHADACFHLALSQLQEKFELLAWRQLEAEVTQIRSVLSNVPILELPGIYTAPRIALVEQNLRALSSFCQKINAESGVLRDPETLEIFERWKKRSGDTARWITDQIQAASTLEEIKEITQQRL